MKLNVGEANLKDWKKILRVLKAFLFSDSIEMAYELSSLVKKLKLEFRGFVVGLNVYEIPSVDPF